MRGSPSQPDQSRRHHRPRTLKTFTLSMNGGRTTVVNLP
jgi:hypothetical protein